MLKYSTQITREQVWINVVQWIVNYQMYIQQPVDKW